MGRLASAAGTTSASVAGVSAFPQDFGWRIREGAVRTITRRIARRVGGPGIVAAFALWLCRRLLLGSALPAGTDMLDVLARTRQNAHWSTILSPWSPSGLGSTRQVSLDNLLGLLALITGDPVRTVKLLLVGLLLLGGLTAYWVVNRWWGNRLAATVAGVLYMTSQASIGRVASGWLHYEALIALAPLILYLWLALLDRFTLVNALAFAVLVGALLFARQDMVLWLVPALGVYVPVRFMAGRDPARALRDLAASVGVIVPVVLLLSLYLIIPLYGGIRAPWLSTGQVFQQIRFNLVDRSLDAYQSLLGLGRDLGYLPFNGEEWWNGHPWLPLPVYYTVQGLIVVSAFAVLWVRRDRRTLYLLACALCAAFLGKGIRGPLGEPYWWGVQHVPVFGSLRGPNRWLIPQAFAYSALAGLTVARLHSLFASGRRHPWLRGRLRAHVVLGAACAAFLLPVAPTLASGFLTWKIPTTSVKLMKDIAADHTSFSVISVPYDQSMTFVTTPGYTGWEHDLGVESALYTGHPALSTNSWDRRGSAFVDFTSSLLSSRNPAFTALLASVGAKYALRFDYPAQAGLVSKASSGFQQQRALAKLPGLVPFAASATGAVYRLPAASPTLSFRTNIAVVIGGRQGLADLATLPGVHMSDWAAYTADDLVTQSGSLGRLLSMMRTSDLILLAGASLNDVAVLASHPAVQVPGITSDPGLDRKVGLLLTDESAREGSLTDQSLPPAGIATSASGVFHTARPEHLELWARVLTSQTAGALTFTLDGRPVRSIVPLDPAKGGFRWIHVRDLALAAGTHTLEVAGSRSTYGSDYEVDETRLISPGDRRRNLRLLQQAIAANAAKVAYSLDLSAGPYVDGTATQVESGQGSFWSPQGTRGIVTRRDPASGTEATRFVMTGPRQFFTVAKHTFSTPQSWAGHTYALVRYRGTGDGTTFKVLVDFNPRHTVFASFPLVDSKRGWQTLALPMVDGTTDWTHVVSIRVATATKEGRGSIELGSVRLLFPSRLVKTIAVPTHVSTARLVDATKHGFGVTIARTRTGSSVTAHIAAGAARVGGRLVIMPERAIPHRHALPVTSHTSGSAAFTYSFKSGRRGVLVLEQTYDAKWSVPAASGAVPTAPVMSLVNGYLFRAGAHSGSISFRNGGLVRIGVVLSLIALACVLAAMAIATRVARRTPQAVAERVASQVQTRLTGTELERAVLTAGAVLALVPFSLVPCLLVVSGSCLLRSASWTRPAVVAIVLVLASPLWIALGRPGDADTAAVAVTFAMVIAVVRATLDHRNAQRA